MSSTTLSTAITPGQFAFEYLNFLKQSENHQVSASVAASIGKLQPSGDSNARVYFFKAAFFRDSAQQQGILTSSSPSNVTYIDVGDSTNPFLSTHFASSCTISGRDGASLTDKTDTIEITLGAESSLGFAGKLVNIQLIQKSGFVEGDRPGGVLSGELPDGRGMVMVTLESSDAGI